MSKHFFSFLSELFIYFFLLRNCFVIPESIPPTRKTRKRKQSVSEEVDIKPCTIALRKRKAVPIIEIDDTKPKKKITKKRKTKKNKGRIYFCIDLCLFIIFI